MEKTVRLTVKQENFARKYIECSCASEAYRHAYNTKRMKPETIWSRGSLRSSSQNSKVASKGQSASGTGAKTSRNHLRQND